MVTGSLNHMVTVKARRLWTDGDLEERLEFKLPRLEAFTFNNNLSPRNTSEWIDVGSTISDVTAVNERDRKVTEPWTKRELDCSVPW